MVSAGKMVSASGTITRLSQTGTDEFPRAMVTLTGTTGESAQCVLDSEHYLDLWDLLVEGAKVTASGKVRRPEAGQPAYIDALSVLADDAPLVEQTRTEHVRPAAEPMVEPLVEQFTLSYVKDGQPHTREPLPRWRVETVGRLLMSMADRGAVSDIKVANWLGEDVTFGFACFRQKQASGTTSAPVKAVHA